MFEVSRSPFHSRPRFEYKDGVRSESYPKIRFFFLLLKTPAVFETISRLWFPQFLSSDGVIPAFRRSRRDPLPDQHGLGVPCIMVETLRLLFLKS